VALAFDLAAATHHWMLEVKEAKEREQRRARRR
jgi:hypothetical protein